MTGLIRLGGVLALAGACAAAWCQGMPRRIILIPLDDRPVSTQLPAMIGRIGGIEVETPPREMLGRFDQPGSPERIFQWLREPGRLARADAVVASLDMVCYGGLIASRSTAPTYQEARSRLYSLWSLRQEAPLTRFYLFGSVMRLAPTATRQAAAWRLLLARHAEFSERLKRAPSPQVRQRLAALESKLPAWEIEKYRMSRERNLRLSLDTMQVLGLRGFDRVAWGQDDASPMGPHLTETETLKRAAISNASSERTDFLQGIDQVPSVLLARAVLDRSGLNISVRPIYADVAARAKVALYESASIHDSFRQQVETAGAGFGNLPGSIPVFINTPSSTPEQLAGLMKNLGNRLAGGLPAGLADINLGKTGTPDERLMNHILQPSVLPKLDGFAGWNTAANTMGTVVPAVVMAEAARRLDPSGLQRQIETKRFLLHRIVSDWEYHRFTRPLAYGMIDAMPSAAREELEPDQLAAVSDLVQRDLSARTKQVFDQVMEGATITTDGGSFEVTGLENLAIRLPWPRAYEVEVAFDLSVMPAVRQ